MSRSRSADDAQVRLQRELDRAQRRRSAGMRALAIVAVASLTVLVVAVAVGWSSPQPKSQQVAAALTTAPATALASVAASNSDEADLAAPSPQPEAEPAAIAVQESSPGTPAEKPPAPAAPRRQNRSVDIGDAGYEPSVIEVSAGAPVFLTVAKGEGCAEGFLIPKLGVSADNSQGPVTVELPALEPGTYRFSCGMEMVFGDLVVR